MNFHQGGGSILLKIFDKQKKKGGQVGGGGGGRWGLKVENWPLFCISIVEI